MKFTPISESYKLLRHIHFPGITPFLHGEQIQKQMVSANLDFKKMEAKIRKQQKDLNSQGFAVSEYEQKLLLQVLAMKPLPTLLTFEFENVYTGGKQMKQDPTLADKIAGFGKLGCQYHQLERGGQVTWHGHGQLTAYLIMDLKHITNLTVKCYVDAVLLRAVQNVLAKYNIKTYTNENPGVWVSRDNSKIASVGCNIQRAVSLYGVGINLSPDLRFLNTYTMCGLPEAKASSVSELTGVKPPVADAAALFANEVAKLLNMSVHTLVPPPGDAEAV